MKQKRIGYFDILRTFGILCVTAGHAVQFLGEKGAYWSNPLWIFIYSFHMPLFMLISGYFFQSSLSLSFKEFLKKKTTQLLIPTFAWSIILNILLAVFYIVQGNFDKLKIFLSPESYFLSFWFLPCLWACSVIYYLGFKLLRNHWLTLIVTTVVTSIIPLKFCDINFLMPFLGFGLLCNLYRNKLEKYGYILLAVFLFGFIYFYQFWKGHHTVYQYPVDFIAWKTMSYNSAVLYVSVTRLLLGLCASIFFLLLFQLTYKYIANTAIERISNKITTRTLGIYVIQTFTLMYPLILLNIRFPESIATILTPFMAVFQIWLCYKIVRFIETKAYAGFLLGRSMRK